MSRTEIILFMIFYILAWVFVITVFSNAAFAFDWKGLSVSNIDERIVESLKTEPERWDMDNYNFWYFEDKELWDKVSERRLYPENEDVCLIHFSHDVFDNSRAYLKLEKPFEVSLHDHPQLTKAVKQFIFNKLYTQGFRYKEKEVIVKKEEIVKPEPEPVIEKKKKSTGRYSYESKY